MADTYEVRGHGPTSAVPHLLKDVGDYWAPAVVLVDSSGNDVGRNGFSVSPTTFTVGTAAYVAGDSIGGILTLANVAAYAGQVIAIDSVYLHDLSKQSIQCTIEWFTSTPVGGTYTDGSALIYAAADHTSSRGLTSIIGSDWTPMPKVTATAHRCLRTGNPLAEFAVTATSVFALIHAEAAFSLTAGDLKMVVSGRRL